DPADRSTPEAETSSDAATSPGQEPTAVGELPELAPPVQVEASTVIADGDPAQLAGLGTALGIGADVIRVSGDVRGDPAAITALAEQQPETLLGIGTTLGTEVDFGWQTATAQT